MIDESTAPEDRAEIKARAERAQASRSDIARCEIRGWIPAKASYRSIAASQADVPALLDALAHAEHVIDKLREVGVVEPREIITVEEIDALPVGSVVARKLDRPDGGDVYVKRRHLEGIRSLPTPLTVLWTPGGAQ